MNIRQVCTALQTACFACCALIAYLHSRRFDCFHYGETVLKLDGSSTDLAQRSASTDELALGASQEHLLFRSLGF